MNQPDMFTVQSSSIAKVGYDAEDSIVWIEFVNGATYVYFDVPEIMFTTLKDASSVGSFFHRNYKNQYAFQRIS